MERIKTWSHVHLLDMIYNSAEESIHLEFKAAASLSKEIVAKKEICKDVSAFANSDGGVIIYGMNEQDHKADSLSFVDGNLFTKEWIEQVINDGIQRRIDGVRIFPIRIDEDLKKSVYVVDVPVSYLAPHMTRDNRYYKRFNFQSVIMEEYEIRQTYERKQGVALEFADTSIEIVNGNSWFDDNEFEFKLTFHIANVGRTMSKNHKLRVSINSLEGVKYSYQANANYNVVRPGNDLEIALSTTNSFPIFPEELVSAMEFTLLVPTHLSKSFAANVEIKQTLFTERERIDAAFAPVDILNELIQKCINRTGSDND